MSIQGLKVQESGHVQRRLVRSKLCGVWTCFHFVDRYLGCFWLCCIIRRLSGRRADGCCHVLELESPVSPGCCFGVEAGQLCEGFNTKNNRGLSLSGRKHVLRVSEGPG